MDIISHYSAGTPYLAPRTAGQTGSEPPEVKYATAEEYRKMIEELESKRKPTDPSTELHNGSETRARLSDTEIAVLANKYDVHDMDDETFDAFLDDLESMGAISNFEKRQLGYKGFVGDFDADDMQNLTMYAWVGPVKADGGTPLFNRQEANGDVFQWINDRIQWQLGSCYAGQDDLEAQEALHKVLAGYINRMDAQRDKTAGWTPTQHGQKIDESSFLYNGSKTRSKLSDAEIAVLANKYDVRDMSDQDYYAFLDDLESMGAISNYEKRRLSGDGSGEDFALDDPRFLAARVWEAPAGADGRGPAFHRWETDGDIFRWINGRIQWQPHNPDGSPELQKELEEQVEVHKVLAGYVNRMDAQRGKTAKAAEKAELLRQIADPNSDFYAGIILKMQAQVKKNEEDGEAQDIVEALGAVLDALSGKKDVSGDKASINKAASELTQKIGDRIARLRRKNPDDPEIVKLESMLKRLQEMGIYFDIGDTDDVFTDEEDNFETLTQLLTRRQKEEAISSAPQ